MTASQHSVQQTAGSLRDLQAFSRLRAYTALKQFSRQPLLTQTVRRLSMDISTLPPTTFIGKIVSTSKERLCLHMPHFYDHENTLDFGKVTVIPKGIRRIRVLGYSPIPYVTMGKVRFTLSVEKVPQHNQNIYIQLGDGSYRTIDTISKNETPVSGVAMYTGDTKFFIASSSYVDKNSERFIAKDGLLLFEDNIISINNYVWGGCSVAALVLIVISVIFSLLSGLIQVTPERVMWWPW